MRTTPAVFDAVPAATERRDGWTVALRYEDGGGHAGPRLVDLSHRRRWDYQDGAVASHRPMELPVPEHLGAVGVHGPLVVTRMNRTQIAIWHLGEGDPPSTPPDVGFTDTGDGHCMLALVGAGTRDVLESITALDLFDPARRAPFLVQGPVLRVPCQVVVFGAELVVMTLARGYGATFAAAVIEAGAAAGLRPGGEEVFARGFAGVV